MTRTTATLPTFLVIGAAKAGTTAVYHYLRQHPEIYMSPHKEPRYFALQGTPALFDGPGDRTRFRFVTELDAYQALFARAADEKARGEASPWYLYVPEAADRIRSLLPGCQLIAILRDPVDRAFSNYLHARQEGLEPCDRFEDAMAAEPERIAANWSPRFHYLQKGFYARQLSRYFDRFDRNRMAIYLYDDLKANPGALLSEMFRFLGVNPDFMPDTRERHNDSREPRNRRLDRLLREANGLKRIVSPLVPDRVRKGIKRRILNANLRARPELDTSIRQRYIDVYREDILQLQEQIHRDLSLWLDA